MEYMEVAKLLAALMQLMSPAVDLTRPTKQKLVDLSHVYNSSTLGWLTDKPFQMNLTQVGTSDEDFWHQNEDIFTSTHWGTHIDAPCHMAKGRWTLEEIPLSQLIAPVAVVDISDRASRDPDAQLRVSDLEHWEWQWNRKLDDIILLVRTGWGRKFSNREAYTGTKDRDVTRLRYPGVSEDAAQWLVQNRKVYGVGIDTLSIDAGANVMQVAAHLPLLEENIYALENVANLHKLPGYGAQLHVSPMKLGDRACGSPTRIIAVLP